MRLWIRVDASVSSDPKVIGMARALGIQTATAVGHLVLIWCAVGGHTPHGKIGDVGSDTVEEWAQWRGKRGALATEFFARFVSDGQIQGWLQRNGKLLERAEKDRKRWHDRKLRTDSAESLTDSPVTVRNVTTSKGGARKPTRSTRTAKVGNAAPWMAGVREVWRGRWPSAEPPKYAARELRPVVEAIGAGEMCNRLGRYIAQLSDPQYLNLNKFAATHDAYADAGEAPAGQRRPSFGLPTPDELWPEVARG